MKNIKTYKQAIFEAESQEMLNKRFFDEIDWNSYKVSIADVKRLLDEGADIDSTNERGETPLCLAAKYKYLDVVKFLIDRGANVNTQREGKITPLHDSVFGGAPFSIFMMLIEAGANIEAEDRFKQTPLHWAAHWGRTDAMEVLINMGANIDAIDAEHDTPLYEAVRMGYRDAARMLIEAGSDPMRVFDDMDEVIEFFSKDGYIDLMPEGPLKAKLKRMQRGKQAFGM